jgi:pimeloyl-ACP methyl ester carboxylesterase
MSGDRREDRESFVILAKTVSFNAGVQLPWLVLIHGLDSSRFTWQNFINENKNRYNMVSFDLRGHGESDFGTNEESFRPSTLVDDIRHSVMYSDSYRVEQPFVLVGHR